uniref:Putative secreted protein n=1 Tax=Ixodes ricinus TaxID=34613 RepID=A0A6B0U295_IXORI
MFNTLLLFSGVYTATKAESGLGCAYLRIGGANYHTLRWVHPLLFVHLYSRSRRHRRLFGGLPARRDRFSGSSGA